MLLAREHAELKQEEVCATLEIAQSTLSDLEAKALSSRRTVQFAELYRCNAKWLATGEGSPGWDSPIGDTRAPRAFSDSDWSLLQDMRDAMESPALARAINDVRAEVKGLRTLAERVSRRAAAIDGIATKETAPAAPDAPIPTIPQAGPVELVKKAVQKARSRKRRSPPTARPVQHKTNK
jgi:hypothetical protein